MSLDPITVEAHPPATRADGKTRLSCHVRINATKSHDIWIDVPADAAATTDDWCVPLMVLPAMIAARPLRIIGRVSPKLMATIPRVQEVFTRFHSFEPVPVTAETLFKAPPASPARTGSFFSGGLDSWYSAASSDGPDDLAFGVGIDIKPGDDERVSMVLPGLRAAAAAAGKPLVRFETNLRELYYGSMRWSRYYVGAALAGCALAMSGRYTRFFIPASFSAERQDFAWGTHSHTDPLWSTEALEIVHHGMVSRLEKVRALINNEGAMRTLRVCWQKDGLKYNCGRCGKCLRTMVALELLGALQRCKTFDRPLNLDEVAAMPYDATSNLAIRVDLLVEATKHEKHAPLLKALCENVVRRPAPDAFVTGGIMPAATSGAATSAAALQSKPEKPRLCVPAKVRREIARCFRRLADWIYSP